MADAVIEVGRNAHGEKVEQGRYVKAPDGRIVLLQAHIPMKAGWELANEDEIIQAAERGRAAGIDGARERYAKFREQLEESERKGEIERDEAGANAARAAAKFAKIPQTPIGMSEEEYQARKGALAQHSDPDTVESTYPADDVELVPIEDEPTSSDSDAQ